MAVSDVLRELRMKLCMSQREFAKVLKINNASVCYYEKGTRLPSYPTIRKIVAYADKQGVKIQINDLLQAGN